MIYCVGFTAIYFKLTIIGNILVKQKKNKKKTGPSDEKDNALRKIKFEKKVFFAEKGSSFEMAEQNGHDSLALFRAERPLIQVQGRKKKKKNLKQK